MDENKRNQSTWNQWPWFPIMILGISVFLLYKLVTIPAQNEEQEWKVIKKQKILEHRYAALDFNISMPLGWDKASSNGSYLFATISKNHTQIECPTGISLTAPNVVKYATEAPLGLLVYEDSAWYIAKVSMRYSSRDQVLSYLEDCVSALRVQNQKEERYLRSYDKNTSTTTSNLKQNIKGT